MAQKPRPKKRLVKKDPTRTVAELAIIIPPRLVRQ